MAQKRPAPAYQEYAAAMMAKTEYRIMSLAERGLLFSLRLECWVNQRLPESPDMLARLLGFDRAEIAAALPAVMGFFQVVDGQITCPELDDYRAHLEGIRKSQSAGGRRGAKKTNVARTPKRTEALPGNPSSSPAGDSRVEPRVLSPAQFNPAQPSQEGDGWRKKDWGLGDFMTDTEAEGTA